MAVESVNEIWSGRTGDTNAEDLRTYKRIYRVITDDFLDAAQVVLDAIPIPVMGAAYETDYENDLKALVVAKSASQAEDDPNVWEVTVSYSTSTSEEEQAEDQTEDPTEEPPRYSVAFRKVNKVLEKDTEGTCVKNSAGQSFDPPIEYEEVLTEISMTRNQANFDMGLAADYQMATNSDTFQLNGYSITPYKAKLDGISASKMSKKGVRYWEVTYTILLNKNGWNPLEILQQGLYKLSSGDLIPCVDENGDPVTAPVLLDAAGAQLAVGGTPIYASFKPYFELPFAPFNFE